MGISRDHKKTSEVSSSIAETAASVAMRKDPRPHQKEAIKDIVDELSKPGNNQRTTCVMACGTGKTLVAKWASEQLGPRTLLAEPSLSLIAQNLREWRAQDQRADVEYLVVCSDQSVVKVNADEARVRPEEISARVTNSPEEIAAFLRGNDKRKILIPTYHSTHLVAEAMALPRVPRFDCTVADEAHRTATREESFFSTILDQSLIRSRTRLFLTATPKVFVGHNGVDEVEISMDNQKLYGSRCHTLSFAKAVNKGLLSDYKLVVAAIPESQGRLIGGRRKDIDLRYAAADLALLRAAGKYNLSKVITFHGSVKRAHDLADRFEYAATRCLPNKDVWIHAVDGKMPSRTREHLIELFREQPAAKLSLLSNCLVLTEGVDVPAVDGVAFYDKKEDEKDIIQAIGRAMRKSPGKQYGYIVVPVVVPDGSDYDSVLSHSDFKKVWQVIRALRAHDEHFEVRCRRFGIGNGGGSAIGPKRDSEEICVDIDLLPQGFRNKLQAKVVSVGLGLRGKVPLSEEAILTAARAFYAQHGRIPTKYFNAPVPGLSDETWVGIDLALSKGLRGLAGGTSLSVLLAPMRKELGILRSSEKQTLSEKQVLAASIKYFRATGQFPNQKTTDSVPGMPGETWTILDTALRDGNRGLPGGSSLSILTKAARDKVGLVKKHEKGELTVKQILAAGSEYLSVNGKIPTVETSDGVPGLPNETWIGINSALHRGLRGLPNGSSLSKVLRPLREKLGIKNNNEKAPLSVAKIVTAARLFYREHGILPSQSTTDPVPGMKGENWSAINANLKQGGRGLPGSTSLSNVLAGLRDELGIVSRKEKPLLTEKQIIVAAKKYYKVTGRLPGAHNQDPVPGMPGEKWQNIQNALKKGLRGLPGGTSLARILEDLRKELGL